MYVKRHYVWSLARVFRLFGYCLTRESVAHRHLVAIEAFFIGCNDIWGLEFAADHATRRWAKQAGPSAPLIHIMGGSSYGAFRDLADARRWIAQFVHELGIKHALIALHLSRSGRVDFHVIAANLTTEDYPLFNQRLLTHARTIARRLTTELNERRMRLGQLPIANLREDFSVYFPDPRLELKAPTLVPTSSPAHPSPEPPPADRIVDTTKTTPRVTPATKVETTTDTAPPLSLPQRPSSPAPQIGTDALTAPAHRVAQPGKPPPSLPTPSKNAAPPPKVTRPAPSGFAQPPSATKSPGPVLPVAPLTPSTSSPPKSVAASSPAIEKSRSLAEAAALWEERCRLLRSAWQDARDYDEEDLERKQKVRRALEQLERKWRRQAQADAALVTADDAPSRHLGQQAREFLQTLVELHRLLHPPPPEKKLGTRDFVL